MLMVILEQMEHAEGAPFDHREPKVRLTAWSMKSVIWMLRSGYLPRSTPVPGLFTRGANSGSFYDFGANG